jgi:hypothetical protein
MRLLSAEAYAADATAGDPRLAAFARHAPGAIRNVATRLHVLDTGTYAFPVSVNDGGERAGDKLANSYVVSPLTAYTGYAEYELDQLGRPWLVWPLRGLARAVGGWLAAARIDRVVQVNNWLLSTNVYPEGWRGDDLPEMTRLLVDAFPDHAIGFRSLNRFSNGALIDRLLALGYIAIPSRQVYLFDARAGAAADFLRRHNTRLDAGLLRNTPYRRVAGNELDDTDYARLEQLYNLLYLDKYCPLNPQFGADWLRAGQRDGWLELSALRGPEGRIDGVLGWFGDARILTAPVVGYDTGLPQKLGLYRLITQLCLQEAARRRCLLNFSSGAAHFKRLRGGQPEIEYSLVHVRHLPPGRRRVWHGLAGLLQGIGVPLMRRLKL